MNVTITFKIKILTTIEQIEISKYTYVKMLLFNNDIS